MPRPAKTLEKDIAAQKSMEKIEGQMDKIRQIFAEILLPAAAAVQDEIGVCLVLLEEITDQTLGLKLRNELYEIQKELAEARLVDFE